MRAIISAIIGIITLLTGLRFALLLFGANPDNVFVSWIYIASAPLISPFTGIFSQSTVLANGLATPSVFEWASLLALLVYSVIGSLLIRLIGGVSHHHAH